MGYVLSANRLTDGAVVYLTSEGDWTKQVQEAHVVEKDDLETVQQAGEEAEARNEVVASYAVELESGGGSTPARLRERIRSFGPTISIPGAADHQPRLVGGPEG